MSNSVACSSHACRNSMTVPANTIIVCANCGNDYELAYTVPFESAGEGKRICTDCVEGLGQEDLPAGIPAPLEDKPR